MRKRIIVPRNDYVVIRVIVADETEAGLILPQRSEEGKQYRVVAVGPFVNETLKVGDYVRCVMPEQVWQLAGIPGEKDLILIPERYVAMKYDWKEFDERNTA